MNNGQVPGKTKVQRMADDSDEMPTFPFFEKNKQE